MLDLGRSISEYERREISFIFELPVNYEEITQDDRWILVGRKGSGKSSYIDFRVSEKNNILKFAIRPTERLNREVLSVYTRISRAHKGDANGLLVEEDVKAHLTVALEFLINTSIMRQVIDSRVEKVYQGDIATIYKFLVANGLHSGSIVRKALKIIRALSKNDLIGDVATAVTDMSSESYEDALDALHDWIAESGQKIVLYIDGIDDYGFDYSLRYRALYNAMLSTTMRINELAIQERLPLRVLFAVPSELFENTVLWNRDKILKKTAYLHWDDKEKVQNLVNKRIAVELGRRKSKPRWKEDRYSVSSIHTWERYFPKYIYNKKGRQELLFEFILRHSMYTPRTVLDICTRVRDVIEIHEYSGIGLDETNMSGMKSVRIVESVEEQSVQIARSIQDVFAKMFDGFDHLLHLFQGGPNGYRPEQLMKFLESNCCSTIKDVSSRKIVDDPKEVLSILFKSGFLGIGRDTHEEPPNCEQYRLEFSYVKPVNIYSRWDIAVISPVFYEFVGVKRSPITEVVPHDHLTLRPDAIKLLKRLET